MSSQIHEGSRLLDGRPDGLLVGFDIAGIQPHSFVQVAHVDMTVVESPVTLVEYFSTGADNYPIVYIHDVDNLRYLFGDVARIYAESSNAIRGFPVEDTAAILIRFNSGVMGTVITSDVVASPYNFESATGENPFYYRAAQDCYRIFGTEASLNFPEMTLWRYTGEGEQGWEDPISSEQIDVEPGVPLKKELRNFCDVIRNDAMPRCPGEEGLKTLEATMAVAEAVRRCKPVTFD